MSAQRSRARARLRYPAVGVLVVAAGVCFGAVRAAWPGSERPCAGAASALEAIAEALDQRRWVPVESRLPALPESLADCPGAALVLARVRAAQGNDSAAERLFAQAIRLAPDDARTHGLFAQYWLSRRQPARADYESSLALSRNPDCAEALVVVGQILDLKGQAPAAFQAFENAARLGRGDAEAHYQLGVVLFRRKLHAAAVQEFDKAVALRRSDARGLDYLALGFEALGDAERSEDAFQRGLRVNDDGPFFDSLLDYNYGRFLLKQRRLAESRPHLDRAVALLPNSRGVYYERGKLNLALERYPAAREDAERALSLREPGSSVLDLQVYYLLATVYARLGETDLARKYAELSRTTPIPDQD